MRVVWHVLLLQYPTGVLAGCWGGVEGSGKVTMTHAADAKRGEVAAEGPLLQ